MISFNTTKADKAGACVMMGIISKKRWYAQNLAPGPQTYKELDYIEVYTNKLKIDQINELEWVDGRIYANIYQKMPLPLSTLKQVR